MKQICYGILDKILKDSTASSELFANEFNKYFTSMGNLTAMKASMISKDQGLIITDSAVFNETEPRTAGLAELDSSFSFKNSSENDVKSVIRGLSSHTASGYDKISARIMKDSCPMTAPVIAELINNSFQQRTCPDEVGGSRPYT